MSKSANRCLAAKMLALAAVKACSEAGMEAARLVFSVSRTMKNMNRPVLICISAKFALPAGIPVCLLFVACGWLDELEMSIPALGSFERERYIYIYIYIYINREKKRFRRTERKKNSRHRLLVRLQNTRDPLKPIREWIVALRIPDHMRDGETSRPLVKDQLSRIDALGQPLQQALDGSGVGNQMVDDLGPSLVEALIPDAGGEEVDRVPKGLGRGTDVLGALLEQLGAQLALDQIHLVDQAEDLGAGTAVAQRPHHGRVVDHVGLELARFDVEDEDQHRHAAEDVVVLVAKVAFHEPVLSFCFVPRQRTFFFFVDFVQCPKTP